MESLIEVKQLPIIEQHLQALKGKWEQRATDAESMVCTEETIQAVKAFRAEINKELEDVEARRKAVKNAVMGPYNAFEAIYKDCITDAYKRAYAALTIKINKVELDIKTRCEDGLREYFAELCAVHHLDWLTYERAGIKVDMASAKAKTPKKLREQLVTFVVGVAESVDRINLLDDSAEIMAEYKKQDRLDAAKAICDVRERHQREEEERTARESRKAEQEREAEMVRRVEALDQPVVVEAPKSQKICYMDFRAHGTMEQLGTLKKFAADNNIKLEVIKNE